MFDKYQAWLRHRTKDGATPSRPFNANSARTIVAAKANTRCDRSINSFLFRRLGAMPI
jgi:hypothetical protein